MSDFYKIGEFADKLGVSKETLRRWDREDKLKPAKVTDGGTRYYSDYQLMTYAKPVEKERYVLAYSRNSSDLLEQYLVARGYKFKIVPDIIAMLDLIEKDEICRVVFYTRDDICLDEKIIGVSAFKLFKFLCETHEVVLDIVKGGDDSIDCR